MCGVLSNAWDDTKSMAEQPWKSFIKGDPVGQAISGNKVSWNPDSNLSKILGEGYSGDPLARHAGIGEDDYAHTGKIAGALAALFFGGEALAGAGGEGGAGVGADAGAGTAGGGTALGDTGALDGTAAADAGGGMAGADTAGGGAGSFGADSSAYDFSGVGADASSGGGSLDASGAGAGLGGGGGDAGASLGGGDGGASIEGGGDAGAGTAGGGTGGTTSGWGSTAWKYAKPLLTSRGVGALTQMYARHQAANQLQGQMNQLNDMYAPGSPEYLQLQKELAARDAAAGRRSQYGPRSVELAGMLSKLKAANMTSPAYSQMLAGQMNNKYGQLNSLAQLYGAYDQGSN